MSKNLQICKYCLHWDESKGFPVKGTGCCKRLGLNKKIIGDALYKKFISFHNAQNPMAVQTGENFGCVLFENNEEQKDGEN